MNTKKNLVSIIVNCFNGEKFLYEALNSIIKQTYKNWEVIFCDNQSNDSSKKIFQSFNNKKFKYFKTNKFLTLYAARNFAISKSRGEFLSFLDTDDVWHKKKLEIQIKFFKNTNVGVVYGNLFVQRGKKKFIYYKKKLKEGYIYDELVKNYNIGILTAVIRKNILFKEKNFFNEKYNIIGDFDLLLKLSKKYMYRATQLPVATYRLHKNNLTLVKRNMQVKELKNWYKQNSKNFSSSEKQIFLKKIINLEFLYFKFNKNIFDVYKYFFFNLECLLNLKNIFILVFPNFLLKKIMLFV